VSITELLKIVRKYHLSLNGQDVESLASIDDADLEKSLTEAEMASARWAWDWLRSRPQILINGDRRYNKLELDEVLALPEADKVGPALAGASSMGAPEKGQKGKKGSKSKDLTLTVRPRIHPSEELVWQTLTRHGVDYKRVPALEWACLQGIASARAEGILQSDLRKLVNQDKRSLPKRTDSLARKGYIAKRTVVVQKMKTSRLWLIDFAPPLVEADAAGLDLSPETLSKDLEPVQWHSRWTGNNIDMDALGRTAVGVVKAFNVMRYSDLRSKMGVVGKRWQMKTLAKTCQRLVDMGMLKYTAASFPGSRKVFKDCLKFIREPTSEEWEKFLATGKKTSQYSDPTRHREPKPNALALYKKADDNDEQKGGDNKSKLKRIFSGWTPEKPLPQTVFEVIKSAGPEGASNPQVSVATVGYQHRRYLSSYLTKVAETQQPPHLKKFQVVSKLVRHGKTSAYMFSAAVNNPEHQPEKEATQTESSNPADRFGFGAVRPKLFAPEEEATLSNFSRLARKSRPYAKRKTLPPTPKVGDVVAEPAPETARQADVEMQELPASQKSTEEKLEEQLAETPTSEPAPLEAMEVEPTAVETAEKPVDTQKHQAREPEAGQEPGEEQQEPSQDAAKEEVQQQETSDEALPSGFTPINKVPPKKREEIALNVQYNDKWGRLRLSFAEKNLVWLRSGRGLKKPLIIRIDDTLLDSEIQDVPDSNDRSLVLKFQVDKDEAPWTCVFILDNEPDSQQNAMEIQEVIAKIKAGEEVDPGADEEAALEETDFAQDATAEATPAESGSRPRGRPAGRGRGGARSKGKKPRRPPLPPGVKPFVCPTCGGAWKNDIGLKYHLEKAQVPCNPNFDPNAVIRRRRRQSPVPPPPESVQSDAGEETADVTTENATRPRRAKAAGRERKEEKKKHRPRPNVRAAMRSTRDVVNGFRGVGAADPEPEEEMKIDWEAEKARVVSRYRAFQEAKPVEQLEPQFGVPAAAEQGFLVAKHSTLSALPACPSTTSSFSESMTYPRSIAAAQNGTTKLPEQAQAHIVSASLPTAPSTPPDTLDHSATAQGLAPVEIARAPSDNTQQSPIDRGIAVSVSSVSQSYPEPPSYSTAEETAQFTAAQTEAATNKPEETSRIKPFIPSSYDRLATDAKKRTAQAFDIINYLLDNNCGVFPGEKALYYAVTKVFLQEFRGQVPPSWKNFLSAVRAIESRKLATVHTHMLRTERGKLQTCTLLIRSGVDPNGVVPAIMKQKMREAYPSIFIPPAFSPTQEELALLQELDKKPMPQPIETKPNANGQKFRSRRKYDEVEVFNAPYYTQNAETMEVKRDPLWFREDSEFPYAGRGPGRPRKRPVEEGAETSPQKKVNVSAQESFGIPSAPASQSSSCEIPVDPTILTLSAGSTSSVQGERETPAQNGVQQGQNGSFSGNGTGPTSLVDAIRVYSLLPARMGGRRKTNSTPETLTKVPREVGRIRNPGLASLPGDFWTSIGSARAWDIPVVKFLEPNTGLFDGAETDDEDEVVENLDVTMENADATPEGAKKPKEFTFVEPSILHGYQGAWPSLEADFFEQHDASFTIECWMPDRQQLLAENVPTSAAEMAEKQKAARIRPQDWVDRKYAKFCSLVNQVAAWEQSPEGEAILSGLAIVPGTTFINVSPHPSRYNMRPVDLKWSDDTQFDLETVPYDDLEEDDYLDVNYVDFPPSKGTGRLLGDVPHKRRKIQQQQHAPKESTSTQPRRAMGRPPKLKLQAIKTMRELTAYPRTPDDFLRHPGEEEEDLNWASENVRLAAFIVVTTLLGGVDRVVDWGLMLRLMPDQTISQLRHYWCSLKKDRMSTIVSLTEKFRVAFLRAYENGELPPLDYNNVLAYDWKGLIKWTTQLDGIERRELPASREELDKHFRVAKFEHGNREWREAFFHPQRSIFNKFQDATSEALALPVDDDVRDCDRGRYTGLSTDMIVAMAWTRSLCVTPVEAYSAEMVLHRRNSLFPQYSKTEITELIMKGVDALQRDGVISKSSSKWSNGRRWRFNTRVLDALEKHAQQEKFVKAAQFKRELDAAFRAGETKRVTYITNDGMIMALLNMQAHGRVRIETTGQPKVPMGHEPGNYETRKYTKKYLHFRLDVVPTETYLYDSPTNPDEPDDLAALRARIRATPPPTQGPNGAIPVWCDVFNKVDAERWLKYLSAVLITLASRGSMGAQELVKTLKPVIMLFEAEMILEWCQRLGVVGSQMDGLAAGVREWWWVVVEAQREGLMG